MSEDIVSAEVFKLKGRVYTLPVVHIFTNNLALFAEQLAACVQQAPRLFDSTPVILDCSAILDAFFDLAGYCDCLRRFGMIPLALQATAEPLLAIAEQYGLPLIKGSAQHDKTLVAAKQDEVLTATKICSTPVRSGQQVVRKEGDLIVTSSVSYGAELLAEGHIHVYGTLRGRALAGITGDKEARIFCQALDAELVAIAGIYCLSDAMQASAEPCQIFLQDDRIHIEPL